MGYCCLCKSKNKDREEQEKDREERETATYLSANDKYIHFLELCLQHPDLGFFDISPLEVPEELSNSEIQKLTLLTILISMLEAGYFLYEKHRGSEMRKRQWQGWLDYMEDWASRPDFRKAWPLLGRQFDKTFQEKMNQLIRDTPPMEK
jgi:hypothetical protein